MAIHTSTEVRRLSTQHRMTLSIIFFDTAFFGTENQFLTSNNHIKLNGFFQFVTLKASDNIIMK